MADLQAIAGRDVAFYVGADDSGPRICARTKTITIGGESIDVTQDCDGAFRTLLSVPASRSMDMSIEGIIRQDDWLLQALDPITTNFLEQYTLVIPGVGAITGDFFIGSFELGAPYNESVTFTATVQSSGAWTFTPEASI